MRFRFACICCGDGRRSVYWSDDSRTRLLHRCQRCGANFNGAGIWLPLQWATNSARGLTVDVDPHADCAHGHGPHSNPNQGGLFDEA